jgi:hypothetical protein
MYAVRTISFERVFTAKKREIDWMHIYMIVINIMINVVIVNYVVSCYC